MNEEEEVEAANFLNLKRKVIFREIQLAKCYNEEKKIFKLLDKNRFHQRILIKNLKIKQTSVSNVQTSINFHAFNKLNSL